MNVLGLFGLASFLRSMRQPKKESYQSKMTPWIGQQIGELSDDLDYYINKFNSFKSKLK